MRSRGLASPGALSFSFSFSLSLSLSFALLLASAACRTNRSDAPLSAPAPGLATSAARAMSASVEPPAAAAASPSSVMPRGGEALFRRAAAGDPADRERLALALGAEGLLERLGDGEERAATALASLPYAEDAEAALGRLAALALGSDPARRRPALEAMLAIAGRPRAPRELVDPEGARRAGEAALSLAAQPFVLAEERALAISTARALAEKGYLDEGRVPRDLDAKAP
jgi:hypothetical protein